MPEYSTTEIAAQCRVSERTIQRWIKEGLLPVQEIMRNRYIVNDADLEKMKPRTIQAHRDELTHRIDALETQMEELQKAIDRLTDVIHAITTPRHREPPKTHYSAKATVQEEQPIASSLPGDLVIATAFAKQHGIHENTANKAIESGRLPVIRGQWKVGRASPTKAWDAEGRSKFYQEYHNSPNFIRCPDCPHSPS